MLLTYLTAYARILLRGIKAAIISMLECKLMCVKGQVGVESINKATNVHINQVSTLCNQLSVTVLQWYAIDAAVVGGWPHNIASSSCKRSHHLSSSFSFGSLWLIDVRE